MVKRLEDVQGLEDAQRDRLKEAGYEDPDKISKAPRVELLRAANLDRATAIRLKRQVGSRSTESPTETGEHQAVTPADWSLTARSATHLAELSNRDPEELLGAAAADLLEDLDWELDPELLGFRRVCGTVRKKNPETGELEPVPHATVHVEDTDCSFLSFYPSEPPYLWLYPFGCHREVIATVRTDACGRFCVWVPRWEIDRILRFRRERICLPELRKPTLEDLLDDLLEVPELPIPRPRPDPTPLFERPTTLDRVANVIGGEVAIELDGVMADSTFGASKAAQRDLMERPAFIEHRAPPLPADVGELPEMAENRPLSKEVRTSQGTRPLDRDRFIGPYLPCRDVAIPEWVTVTDVPDITFRVTQDVDGDGDEETIYDEGFFDIRWNEDPIPEVSLVAAEHARSSPTCNVPEIDPGECGELQLLTAGLMSIHEPYHDADTGYAQRPNRPWTGGQRGDGSRPDTKSPYTGVLQLHGCVRVDDASYYRVNYAYEGNAPVPFTDLSWYVPRIDPTAAHYQMVPDAEGWYEVPPEDELVFPYWVLNWPTGRFPDGRYDLSLEIADASKNPIAGGTSDPVALVVDNANPSVSYTLEWYDSGEGRWDALSDDDCPVIWRSPGESIQLRTTYAASAQHFRNVAVYGIGCGADPSTHPADTYRHWYTDPDTDNSEGDTVRFEVGPGLPDGTYTFGVHAHGRAFNPSGGRGGPSDDWYYDHAYAHAHPRTHVSIVTE